jgi:hypothetical protein
MTSRYDQGHDDARAGREPEPPAGTGAEGTINYLHGYIAALRQGAPLIEHTAQPARWVRLTRWNNDKPILVNAAAALAVDVAVLSGGLVGSEITLAASDGVGSAIYVRETVEEIARLLGVPAREEEA